MPNALFSDVLLLEANDPTAKEAQAGTAPGGTPSTTNSLLLHFDPEILERNRETVETFLQALRHLKSNDFEPLEAAVSELAGHGSSEEWMVVDKLIAADNVALRDRFVAQDRPLTIADLAEKFNITLEDAKITAARWKAGGEIVSASHRGNTYYPAFQFRNGHPHPTIKLALATLPATFSAWQQVIWFVAGNGWLDNDAPVDHLDDPHAIVAAARRELEPVMG